MAFDEALAARMREQLIALDGFSERKMFGGIAFMLHGNMACGVIGGELMVRVGPVQYEDALEQPHTRLFDFTGRPMRGWVVILEEGIQSTEQLTQWIDLGVAYARTFPPK